MANLRTIRRRVSGVKNTRQLTRAMKMVAAAKLRRSQERVEGGRPYMKIMAAMIKQVREKINSEQGSDLLNPLQGPNRACLVFSSDRGLCGSYNSNVMRSAMQLRRAHPQMQFILFGKRIIDFARKNNFPILASYPNFFLEFAKHSDSWQTASTTIEAIFAKCQVAQIGELQAIYTHFVSAGVQKLSSKVIFPLSFEAQPSEANAATDSSAALIIEPNPHEVLTNLVRLYARFTFFHIAAEVVASENGARMTAMDSATRNAKDMIDRLTLEMNRARQATITKELLEIISGAEALEK